MKNVVKTILFSALVVIIASPVHAALDDKARKKAEEEHGTEAKKGKDEKKRPITATDLHEDSIDLINQIFYDGKEKDWIQTFYQDRKVEGKTFAEAIKLSSEKNDEASFKPVSKFIAELQIRIGTPERWTKERDLLKKKIEEMKGEKGEKAGDPQTEQLVKLLWWAVNIHSDNPDSKVKKPETEEFNKVMDKAIKDEKAVAAEIQKLKTAALGGNEDAKKKLRGDASKDANDPANKYAITGPGGIPSLTKMDPKKAGEFVGALSWKDPTNGHAFTDFYGPKGEQMRLWGDKGTPAVAFSKAVKALADGQFKDAHFASAKFDDKSKWKNYRWTNGALVEGKPDAITPTGGGTGGTGGSQQVSAQGGAKDVYTAKCGACHSGANGFPAGDNKAQLNRVSLPAGDAKKMPPKGMSAEEEAKVKEYLSGGGKETI